MATTSSFTFTNVTAGDKVDTVAVGPVSSYAKIQDEPTEVVLTNKTATIDQPELISYRGRKIDRVATVNTISYPSKVQEGVEYGIRLDEVLRTVDATGNILFDDPIVASITFKHPRSAAITNNVMTTVLGRLLGALYDTTADKYRFDDLMRQALAPTED